MFQANRVKDECVQWIRDFFSENGPDCNAVVGISGGKDSSTVAALCVEALGLPEELIEKTPIDGLSGMTDEENLGFSYQELDRYIRTGMIEDSEKKRRIDRLHDANLFKLQLMPAFDPHIAIRHPECERTGT
ncbi:MAG: hypothetical protein IJX90_03605 [Blautia sp.]|nr:hypothetical protein [Blautia sp.]